MNSATNNNDYDDQPTDPRWYLIGMLLITSWLFFGKFCKAQIVTVNPLEITALAEGNEVLNAQVSNEIDDQEKTALLQNTIAAEFTQMKSWEKKYNQYLKDAEGYASTIKASTTLYTEGVRTLLNLYDLKTAISKNPQGIIASGTMNNLYIETATELVSIFTTLKDAVATGGKENMLTGAERSKTLWALDDKLSSFNKKLNKLHLSIRYYTMTDVWDNVTAGMIDRDYSEIATSALDRWKRRTKP